MADFGDFLAFLGAGVLIAGILFVFCLIGTLIGLAVGWVVSITPLGPFVTDGFNSFGFHATGMLPQIGAAVGFVSGLFSGSHYSSSKKDD